MRSRAAVGKLHARRVLRPERRPQVQREKRASPSAARIPQKPSSSAVSQSRTRLANGCFSCQPRQSLPFAVGRVRGEFRPATPVAQYDRANGMVRERSRTPQGPALLAWSRSGRSGFHRNARHPAAFAPTRCENRGRAQPSHATLWGRTCILDGVNIHLRPGGPVGAGPTRDGKTGKPEPTGAVEPRCFALGPSRCGQQRGSAGGPGEGLLPALQRHDIPYGRTRVRPAAQRPAFSGFAAARGSGRQRHGQKYPRTLMANPNFR